MGTYPILKIPSEVQAALSALPPIPEVPKEPVAPVLNQLEKPERASFITLLFGFGICLLSGKLFETKSSTMLGLLLIATGLGLIVYYLSSLSSYPDKSKLYETSQRSHENDFKLRQAHYNNNLLPNHIESINDYKRLVEDLKKPANILLFRINKIVEAYKKSAQLIRHKNPEIHKTGVSENDFGDILVARFPNKIFTGATFKVNSEPSLYLPDFVYSLPKKGFNICIEIDEPYVGATGKPIHFIGADDNRDKAFDIRNWFVIRFSESQIISQPNECCDFIESIAYAFAMAPGSTDTIIDTGKLSKVEQWTKEQAHKMAFVRYRNTYLSSSLRETLTLENLEKDIKSEQISGRYLPSNYDDNDLPF
ncbi:MAG TPA: hypothetical protein VF598_14880 [Hymenobacter sp.]|jgi:very-short-patch-repair endonuclease